MKALLTPWSRVLLEKLIVSQLNFLPLKEPEGSLLCSLPILSQMHPVHTFLHYSPGFPRGLFPSGFLIQVLYVFLICLHATCPAYLLDFNTLIIFGEAYKLQR
jgi:hypothetical protein